MEFCPWKKNGSISLTLFEVISFSCEANLFFHYSFRNLVGNEVILPECEESIIRLLVFCNLDVSVDDLPWKPIADVWLTANTVSVCLQCCVAVLGMYLLPRPILNSNMIMKNL